MVRHVVVEKTWRVCEYWRRHLLGMRNFFIPATVSYQVSCRHDQTFATRLAYVYRLTLLGRGVLEGRAAAGLKLDA